MKFAVSCLIGLTSAINTTSLKSQQHAYDSFAEKVLAQVDAPSCTTTRDRNLEVLPDFYSLVAASGTKYTDNDFSADDSSYFWGNMGEGYWQGLANHYNNMSWKRAKDTF